MRKEFPLSVVNSRDYRRQRSEVPAQFSYRRFLLKYQRLAGGEGGIRTPDRLAPMPHFECGAIDHSATSPGAIAGDFIRPGSGRVLGEDGGADKAWRAEIPGGQSAPKKGGTARRDKNRRSRVASLKLWPGSAASPASPSDDPTLAISPESATRSRF